MTVAATISQPLTMDPTTTESDLLAAARSLVPVLRSRYAETETLGRLPASTLKEMEQARLFDVLVPKRYGGLQTSLRTFMDVVVELGKGDGSVSWTHSLLAGGNWIAAAIYPEQVLEEVFSQPNIRLAGVMTGRGVKTRRMEDGILIEEGVWSFNSGIHHAQWDGLGIPLKDDTGKVIDTAFAMIPTSQITLLNDWDTVGLRGTGSVSVSVKDVFVTNERIAPVSKAFSGRYDYAGNPMGSEGLYRLPLMPFFAMRLVWPALGMAKAALELFLEKAPSRIIPFAPYEKQDDAPVTHIQFAEASVKIDAAELLLRRAVDDLDAITQNNTKLTLQQRARMWADVGVASRMIWEAVDLLAGASGGSSAHKTHPMNRIWRDVRVAGMHAVLNPTTAMEALGRVLLGKDPKAPFL
ncbi:acyl-CoA dehydrogenase family protein [Terriglobus saanensis]|uniref:Acyl-CoA dehydrogenase type 2 domain protein n=1 Tax=Terriglobus saanensis (strain ATCC BAA-1853 / DSM 23119 / SP1PR4) TaxID=401053 RepID=E8V2E4_TERSS|nr:acyl-CoA dehydrogenase family protein [Terriglobus saanensis]ADV81277.1 Acyl-CoA dehydrogenase type 2 domain protein [Terriglobus saanensis SP1PR4]